MDKENSFFKVDVIAHV